MKKRLIIVFILTLLLLLSCTEKPPETYTVEIIDGVRHVHNRTPLWGDEKRIALEFVRTIGELDVTNEWLQLFKPVDAACGANGCLFVLDSGNSRVVVYGPDGGYLFDFGRIGQGPGEFSGRTSAIDVVDGIIYVEDGGNRRIHVFTPDGTFLDSFSYVKTGFRMRVMQNGSIIQQAPQPIRPTEGGVSAESLFLYNPVEQAAHPVLYFTKFSRDYEASLHLNTVDFVADGNDVIVSYRFRNVFEKLTASGRLLLRFDRPCGFDIPDSPNDYRDIRFASRGIGTDGTGRIWTLAPVREMTLTDVSKTPGDYAFSLFSRDGLFLGAVPAPRIDGFRIFGERLFFIDPADNMAVYEYRIVDL